MPTTPSIIHRSTCSDNNGQIAMDQKDAGPVLGDIIIHKRHASGDVYILLSFQQASQLTCPFYAEAVKHATAFAVKDALDAWYTEDGQTYRSLALHRPQRGKHSRQES